MKEKKLLFIANIPLYFMWFFITLTCYYILQPSMIRSGWGLALLSIIFMTILLARTNKFLLSLPAILLLSFMIRFLWFLWVPTEPKSDFSAFWRFAQEVPQNFMIIFKYKSPVTILFYSLPVFIGDLFNINPLKLAYFFNIILGTLVVYLVYLCAIALKFSKNIALLAAFLFCCMPSSIIYTTITCSENVYLPLFMLAFLFTIKTLQAKSNHLNKTNDTSYYTFFILACFFFALAHMTRSIAVLPFVVACFIICYSFSKNNLLKNSRDFFLYLLLFCLFLAPVISYNYFYRKSVSLNAHSGSYYNLFFGTSFASQGVSGQEARKNMAKIKQDYPKTWKQELYKVSFSRIIDHPIALLKMAFGYKWKRMWVHDDEMVNWASKGTDYTAKWRVNLRRICDIYWFVILFGCLLSCSFIAKFYHKNRWLFLWLIAPWFILIFLHIFIEVKPRFHHPITAIFTILASYGFYNFVEFIKIYFSKIPKNFLPNENAII